MDMSRGPLGLIFIHGPVSGEVVSWRYQPAVSAGAVSQRCQQALSWGPLGPSWGPLGAVLEALLGRLGTARHGVEHKMASGEPQEPFLS